MLYDYYHLGNENDFEFDLKEYHGTGNDFKNDLCNNMVKYYPDYFEDENKYCKALFIKSSVEQKLLFFFKLTFLDYVMKRKINKVR